jgi:L-fuconolactonase
VIDAHHHLWDTGVRDYAWMDGGWADPLRGRFDRVRLGTVATAEATIAVQAVHDVGETVELLASGVAGVVGWVDLTSPEVADAVAELRSGPGGGALVGLRHQAQDEADPEWLLRPEVMAGIAASGLAYDLLVKPPQWGAALELARRLPGTSFVLDHAGKPEIAAGGFESWAAWISSLATVPNVTVKLSGLVTEASWTGWTAAELLPYARRLLTAFGSSRVMFGSDWPVCTLAASYAQVVGLAEEACAELSAAERDAVFGGTARRVYQVAI